MNLVKKRVGLNLKKRKTGKIDLGSVLRRGKFNPRRDEILKFYEIYRPLAEILKFSGRGRSYGRTRNREKFCALFYAAFTRPQRLPKRRLFAQEVFQIRLRVAAD